MKYHRFVITAPAEELERITAELMELGITATEMKDPAVVDEIMAKKEDFEWDYIDPGLVAQDRGRLPELSVYVKEEDREGYENVEALLHRWTRGAGSDQTVLWQVETVDDEDWIHSYQEHFTAQWLTDRILVCPSWEWESQRTEEMLAQATDMGNSLQVLELDPGMAFGTGDHATTALCARLMEEAGCRGKTVLDIGTGSGILAIAAAFMGCKQAIGVDIDPVAVDVARENVEKNGVEDRVTICEGNLTAGLTEESQPIQGEIIVANLMAELICSLAPHIPKHLKEGGIFIASGILDEKESIVTRAISEAGMQVKKTLHRDGWCAISAARPSNVEGPACPVVMDDNKRNGQK